jgi:hypothetical protein
MQPHVAHAPQTFDYHVTQVVPCRATFDDAAGHLEVKQGIRTWRVPFAQIHHVYFRRNGPFDELIVGTEPSPGKKKVFRFSADGGQPGFHAVVEALVARRPDTDRRALPASEAMKLIGARNVELIVLVVGLAIVPVILAIALLPTLVHGLDRGETKLSLAKLAKDRSYDSRNLVITGARLETSKAMSLTTVNKRNGIETGRSTKFYIPLVPKDWDDGDPVHVVLETKELLPFELEELESSSSFRGVARDVLWEGLGSKQRTFLEKDQGLRLSKDLLLFEYRAKTDNDLAVYLGVVGGTTFVFAVIGLIVYLKHRKA